MLRRIGLLTGLVLLFLVGLWVLRPASIHRDRPELRLVALGDSVSRAANASRDPRCVSPVKGFPFVECLHQSWSTGSDPQVQSIAQRLQGRYPDLRITTRNLARSATYANDLPRQARQAVAWKADVATVLVGGGDACINGLVPAAATNFRAQTATAFAILSRGGVRIRLLTSPSIYNVWEGLHRDPRVRRAWATAPGFEDGRCPSLLRNPASTDPRVEQRREQVREQQARYDRILLRLCRSTPGCRSDGGRQGRQPVGAAYITDRDSFHPSVRGEARLAENAWQWIDWSGLDAQRR